MPDGQQAARSKEQGGSTYERAGVAAIGGRAGFRALIDNLRPTLGLRTGAGRSLLDFGYFASVLDLPGPLALAMSTDGIGTKAIVAEMMDRYDTIGIDCVAMNANDVLCVGAEPISMTDYIAVDVADDRLLSEIGVGLRKGAEYANISIPGGEISQIPEIIRAGERGFGFDLAGTCVGLVDKERILTGAGTEHGDVVIGIASSGIHSNGLTLARDILFHQAGFAPMQVVEELGRPVGEELLEPTRIYVKPVLRMLAEGLAVKALAHITSDGLLNLTRAATDASYVIDSLPETPAIFELLERTGSVEAAEMFRVYNMGVGFCVVAAPTAAERIQAILREPQDERTAGWQSWRIGYVEADGKREVRIPARGLVGRGETFTGT